MVKKKKRARKIKGKILRKRDRNTANIEREKLNEINKQRGRRKAINWERKRMKER